MEKTEAHLQSRDQLENEEKNTPPATPAENEEEEKGESGSHQPDNTDDELIPPSDKKRSVERWNRLTDELKELKQWKEETLPLLEELKKPQEETEIPAWFVGVYGNDQNIWKQYSKYSQTERAALKEDILRELASSDLEAEKARRKAEREAEESINNQLDALTDKGYKFNRNELLSVAVKYQPTTDDGTAIDLEKAYEIWKITGGVKSADEKKKVADATMGGSKPENEPVVMSTNDFQGKHLSEMIRQKLGMS